jgi:2,4-dienoyl-CoA reductase-like NADH-dependent reductase (Old Yellow Enzyme family)
MGTPALFEPIHVGTLDLPNRIVVAPMCQYSAENGCMNDWHLIRLGQLSISGAAVLMIEATADLPEGRITWADVGLWNDETEAATLFRANDDTRYPDLQRSLARSD